MFRFIHAADLHLDSPFRGLERIREGSMLTALRGATRRAFENLVQRALDEQVAFVVLVGDLFDGDWPDFNTGLFFTRQVGRLKEAHIPVFLAKGNHDAESVISRRLTLPENVHELSTRKASTHRLESLKVAIHGMSYAKKAVFDNLAAQYPQGIPGYYNIGLLHTSLTRQYGHEPYAPCTEDELRSKHYHYWALGHVHTREVVSTHPFIVFPGNTQGRSVRETGVKGCTLVQVEEDFTTTLTHCPLDVVRWEHLHLDLSHIAALEDVYAQASLQLRSLLDRHPDHPLIVRLELEGLTAVHEVLQQERERVMAELRAQAASLAPDRLWLEKIKLKTRSQKDALLLTQEALELSPLGPFLEGIRTLTPGHAVLQTLEDELRQLRGRLPAELFDPAESLMRASSTAGGLSTASPPAVAGPPGPDRSSDPLDWLSLTQPERLRAELEAFLLPRIRQAMGGVE